MRLLITMGLAILAAVSSAAQFSDQRQVLIFGEPGNKLLVQQLAWLKKDSSGLKERDIVISMPGKSDALHKKYKADPSTGFLFILVGKDGGEKHRSKKPVTARELFALIDAMPMRQSEMKQ